MNHLPVAIYYMMQEWMHSSEHLGSSFWQPGQLSTSTCPARIWLTLAVHLLPIKSEDHHLKSKSTHEAAILCEPFESLVENVLLPANTSISTTCFHFPSVHTAWERRFWYVMTSMDWLCLPLASLEGVCVLKKSTACLGNYLYGCVPIIDQCRDL